MTPPPPKKNRFGDISRRGYLSRRVEQTPNFSLPGNLKLIHQFYNPSLLVQWNLPVCTYLHLFTSLVKLSFIYIFLMLWSVNRSELLEKPEESPKITSYTVSWMFQARTYRGRKIPTPGRCGLQHPLYRTEFTHHPSIYSATEMIFNYYHFFPFVVSFYSPFSSIA